MSYNTGQRTFWLFIFFFLKTDVEKWKTNCCLILILDSKNRKTSMFLFVEPEINTYPSQTIEIRAS